MEVVTGSLLKEIAIAAWRWIRGRRGALSPEQIVERRLKWKPIFDERLLLARRDKIPRDVTVKDVGRLNEYPNIDEHAEGISPWFRAGLVGTNDRGLLLLLGWHGLSSEALGFLDLQGLQGQNASEGGNAALIGYVPFEQVVDVDWNGDDYNTRPSLYLHFDAKRDGPYERIALCLRRFEPVTGADWFSEICDIDDYRDACSKLGIKQSWLRPRYE